VGVFTEHSVFVAYLLTICSARSVALPVRRTCRLRDINKTLSTSCSSRTRQI